jgi:hypothetical protein
MHSEECTEVNPCVVVWNRPSLQAMYMTCTLRQGMMHPFARSTVRLYHTSSSADITSASLARREFV